MTRTTNNTYTSTNDGIIVESKRFIGSIFHLTGSVLRGGTFILRGSEGGVQGAVEAAFDNRNVNVHNVSNKARKRTYDGIKAGVAALSDTFAQEQEQQTEQTEQGGGVL